jgi:serine/threonine protein phosphatase PrpC
MELLNEKLYSISKKGIKQVPNQDDYFILIDGNTTILCVLDGHGVFGHYCSNFVQTLLPRLLLSNTNYKSNLRLAIYQTYIQVNEALYGFCEQTVNK